MRAILITRYLAIRYEDEVIHDTVDEFLHETLPGARLMEDDDESYDDDDDDDDEESYDEPLEGEPSRGLRDASGRRILPASPGTTAPRPSRFSLDVKPPPKLVVNKHPRVLMRYASSVVPGDPEGSNPNGDGRDPPIYRRQESAQSGSSVGGSDQVDPHQVVLSTKDRIFFTFNDPDFSETARWLSLVILTLIVVSTTSFILDTRPEYEGHYALWVTEVFCIAVFTLEYVVKLTTAPRRLQFVRQPMNIIDLAAIVPFYFELITVAVSGGNGGSVPTGLLRLFRLFRVFRVLKLGTRMKKLEVVAAAVGDSLDMFVMLVFLLLLALVMFSTLIYFCERNVWVGDDAVDALAGDPFASIPRSFWWCMVTLMTVGYGDAVPLTIEGKIVASITMITSVLIMALPISVIGANFTHRWLVYRDDAAAKAREETFVPSFYNLVASLKGHSFVLDEVLTATQEMEVAVEQESGELRILFDEATEIELASNPEEKNRRRELMGRFDARFKALQDSREELDEVLACAELVSSNLFTQNLETCINKNRRLEIALDGADATISEVDALIRKVNRNDESGRDWSSTNSIASRAGTSPSMTRQNTALEHESR
jgi:hypothetical protein